MVHSVGAVVGIFAGAEFGALVDAKVEALVGDEFSAQLGP